MTRILVTGASGFIGRALVADLANAGHTVRAAMRQPADVFPRSVEVVAVSDLTRTVEWRSLLRQIGHAPDLEWPRWRALQAMAKAILNETESPTITDLPPLEYHQTRRVDHRLILRRH